MIVWKIEERTAVVEAFHLLTQTGAISTRGPESWRKAQQKALKDPRRWRPFSSPADGTSLNKFYKKLLDEGHFKSTSVVPAIQVPQVDLSRVVNINGRQVPKEIFDLCASHIAHNTPPPAAPTLDSVFRRMIDEQLASNLPKVFAQIDERLEVQQAVLGAALNDNYKKFMRVLDPNWVEPVEVVEQKATPHPEKEHKPVLILVNAMAPQTQSVQKEFPQFDVRQVRDRVPGEVSPLLVVGFTKFMSASLDSTINNKYHDAYLRIGAKSATSEAKRSIRARLQNVLFEGGKPE